MVASNPGSGKRLAASPVSVHDEYSKLEKVIIGLGSPYQPDKAQVAGEMHEFPFVPSGSVVHPYVSNLANQIRKCIYGDLFNF